MLNSFLTLFVTFKVSIKIRYKAAAISGFIESRPILISFFSFLSDFDDWLGPYGIQVNFLGDTNAMLDGKELHNRLQHLTLNMLSHSPGGAFGIGYEHFTKRISLLVVGLYRLLWPLVLARLKGHKVGLVLVKLSDF